MGLESGSYISALVSTNPVGATDPKSQGDDHLRFIKAKLLETFANVTGAVTASHTELNLVAGATQGLATTSVSLVAANTAIAARLPLAGGTMTGDITMSGASIFDANASIAAHATTMNPWSLGNYVTCTGAAVTFTAMANAPQAGAEVELYMNAAHVFTDGAVFEVDGDANYTAVAGDRVLLRAKSTTVFTVHPRKKDGTAVVSTSVRDYVLVRDEKTSSTHAGTFTSGAWQTRTINTEVTDTANICSIAANQITLAAGTYEAEISAPAYQVDSHKVRLQNITDATTVILGTTEFTLGANNITTRSFASCRFTIATAKTFEVQHRCTTTIASTGFGYAASFGDVEVYTVANFVRVAT